MDQDMQAAIAASLADQGKSEADEVIFVSEDIFSVQINDSDGDTILFLLVEGDVQQYVNGNLEIPRVTELSIDEWSGRVVDARGSFLVPTNQKPKLGLLKILLSKAGIEIKKPRVEGPGALEKSFTGIVEDDDVDAALRASIEETRRQNQELALDLHRERSSAVALFRQHSTLNQFHPFFQDIITQYQAPHSICGYLTIANCRLLRSLLRGAPTPLQLATLQEVGSKLVTQRDRVRMETERAMASIAAKRKRYIQAHAGDFPAAERRKYMRAWVANFEIADELIESGYAQQDQPCALAPSLHFVRYNEFPQLRVATHEERQRILTDQQRFGGHLNAKGESIFGPGDSAHIIQRFVDGAPTQLLTPAEWKSVETEDCPRVFAVDLNGHFVAAVAARVSVKPEAGPLQTVVQLFNTTESNYLDWPMASDLHRFVFGGM